METTCQSAKWEADLLPFVRKTVLLRIFHLLIRLFVSGCLQKGLCGLFCQTASRKSNTLPRLVGFHGNYRAGRWLEQVRWLVFILSR